MSCKEWLTCHCTFSFLFFCANPLNSGTMGTVGWTPWVTCTSKPNHLFHPMHLIPITPFPTWLGMTFIGLALCHILLSTLLLSLFKGLNSQCYDHKFLLSDPMTPFLPMTHADLSWPSLYYRLYIYQVPHGSAWLLSISYLVSNSIWLPPIVAVLGTSPLYTKASHWVACSPKPDFVLS